MDETDSFGYWVRRRRKALDLTQEELAQHVGCAVVTLRKIEADERHPSPQMAERLAGCLALTQAERATFLAAAGGSKSAARLPHPAAAGGHSPSSNLPASMTQLVGRADELTQISESLRHKEVRLLTLTGPVGVGKTRLALEVGWRVRKCYRDGVFVVALASIQDPGLVAAALAAVLGVRESRDLNMMQAVINFLAGREMLIIFDNFEHLLPAASFLAHLLAACPHLHLLVTSRARLHLYGEHEFVVAPLPVPDLRNLVDANDAPSVQLFCARARAARADFQLTPSLTLAVAEICRRLDGLPLAIELAAARINLFSVQEVQQRLERDFTLLSQTAISPRMAPGSPLQHAHGLRNAINWSYGLLSPGERSLMARLAVFASGFFLSAAEAVCTLSVPVSAVTSSSPVDAASPLDVAVGVEALREQSLLLRHAEVCETHIGAKKTCWHCPTRQLRATANAESRFTMIETIREFALEQLQALGELRTMQQQHAEYYARWAQQAEAQLDGPAQALWLARLEQELDNLRAALTWLLAEGRTETAAMIACSLGMFWQRHGHYSEGRGWLEHVLAQLADTPVPDTLRARTLQRTAVLAYRQGDWQSAQQWLAESMELYQTQHDSLGIARVLFDLGWIAIDHADWPTAIRLNQESLDLARVVGDACAIYRALTNLGWVRMVAAAWEEATTLFTEALTVARRIGHNKGEAVSLANLGWVALHQHDASTAADLAGESLRICYLLGEQEVLAECLEILAAATAAAGETARGVTLHAAAAALWLRLHVTPVPAPAWHDRGLAALRQQLTADEFAAAWQQGHNLSLEGLAALALACDAGSSRGAAASRA